MTAVPQACHSQQSRPVPSGQPRTTPRRPRLAPLPASTGHEGYRGWFRFYSIATLLVLVGFGTASSIAMGGLEEDLTPWAGGFERINAYAFFAWLVVLAVTMLRRSLGQVTPEKGVAETEVVQTSEPSLVARVDEETSTRPEAGDRDGFTPGPLSPVT